MKIKTIVNPKNQTFTTIHCTYNFLRYRKQALFAYGLLEKDQIRTMLPNYLKFYHLDRWNIPLQETKYLVIKRG
jgi:hypothetical protein